MKMLRTVHGALVVIIVTVLFCGFCCCLQITREDVVTKKYNNLDSDFFQAIAPLESNEDDVDIISEDDVDLSFSTIKTKQANLNVEQDDTIAEVANTLLKKRMKRQTQQGYGHLYPQLPSAPSYNPYPSQPNYNPAGQNPYSSRPTQWSLTNSSGVGNFSPHNYNPNSGIHNQNQGTYNYSQPGYPSPYNNNQNTGYKNSSQVPYNPYTRPTTNANSSYPSYNTATTRYPHNPQNGKYPSYNTASTGSFRPPNASFPSNTSPWPLSASNSSYPTYPGVKSPPSYNMSTRQRPHYPTAPYSNNVTSHTRPTQWQPNNPGANAQYPSNTNFNPNYPTSNGAMNPYKPTFNMSTGQHPHYPTSPYSNNVTSHTSPTQWQPNNPGSNGQYPSNTNLNPNYPSSYPYSINATSPTRPVQWQPNNPGQYPSNGNFNPNYYPSSNFNAVVNSSVPNYPQNNFYYPQTNNSTYDPRKVPPQNFSYH